MDPAHEPTIRALEVLMAGKDEPVLAAAVLEPIYESAGEWDRVIAVYEVMAANSDDVPRTVELLCSIAEIEERRLSHQNAAFDVYGRALRIDPTNQDVLAHLDRLASETGHWAKLANLFASEIEKVDEPRRAIDMLLRLARIYEEETGQVEEAIATFRRAMGADPDSKDALIALDRLYVRAQQWDDLADVVRREIKVAPSDEDRVTLTFRLAQIYELALMDMPKAVEAYREILSTEPAHAETRAALERMFIGRHAAARDRRRAGAAISHRRGVGEAAPDLRGAAGPADRRRRAPGAAAPAGARSPSRSWSIRSRRSDGGRWRSRKTRLRRRGWTSCCGWRARPTSGTRTSPRCRRRRARSARRRCGATCCCASRPASRTTSATWNAPRRRWCRCWRARQGPGGAGVAGSHLREPGDVREPGGRPAPADLDDRRHRRAGAAEPAARARVRRGARGGRSGDRQLPGGAGAASRDRARRWTRSSGSISAASAGRSCTASTRSWSTSPATRRAWPTATRGWPSWRPTRWTIATRPSSCGAASSTSAAKTRSRCRASPTSTRWRASGRS